MKIIIEPNSVDYADIHEKLIARFPDYEFKLRGKMLVAKKSSTIGANIVFQKRKIMVGGSFPTMGGTMIFVLTLILLGFLIPLIIYFAVFHRKMKILEKEIGTYIQEEYLTI